MTERAGLGVDAKGNAVVDPTANVIALVEANAKSAAMLRDADIKFNDKVAEHQKEIAALRAEHEKETRTFDRDQSRAIREVDQTNAQANAAQILQAVNTNASVAQQTALTLAKQVTDTAAAQETRQSARDADTAKRLSAVELSMSKGEGKQQVSDPALTATLAGINASLVVLTANQDKGAGKSEGMSDTMKMILAVGGMLLAFLAYEGNKSTVVAPQQPVVVLPPGTITLPSTPTRPQ